MHEVDMKIFCSEHAMNGKDITKPFSDNEFTYATDGFVCIRTRNIDEIACTTPPVDISSIIFQPGHQGEWLNLPIIPFPEIITCNMCEGAGKLNGCEDCDATGEVTFYLGDFTYDCECKNCQGTGILKGKGDEFVCAKCGGSGKIYPKRPASICGELLSWESLEKIYTLKNVKIFIPSKLHKLNFKFDGGEGVVGTNVSG